MEDYAKVAKCVREDSVSMKLTLCCKRQEDEHSQHSIEGVLMWISGDVENQLCEAAFDMEARLSHSV